MILADIGIEVLIDHYLPSDMVVVLPRDAAWKPTDAEREKLRAAGDDPLAKFHALAEILGARGQIAVARNVGEKLGLTP